MDFYKIDPEEELIIIYDDIALAPGKLRVRAKGSAGGHNGIRRISSRIWVRSRFFADPDRRGEEKPAGWDLADYVLGRFPAEEEPTILILRWSRR